MKRLFGEKKLARDGKSRRVIKKRKRSKRLETKTARTIEYIDCSARIETEQQKRLFKSAEVDNQSEQQRSGRSGRRGKGGALSTYLSLILELELPESSSGEEEEVSDGLAVSTCISITR